jgi:hypothetical protein
MSVESIPRQIKQATDAFDSFQDRFKTTQRLLKLGIPIPVDAPIEAAKQVANALERLKNNASTSIRDLRSNVRLNMKLIASNMDTQSAEGKQALAANFEAAVSSVRKSMHEKTVSVREGMAEIRRLVSQELTDVYGLSLHDASNIAKGNGKTRGTYGDTEQQPRPRGRRPDHARGRRLDRRPGPRRHRHGPRRCSRRARRSSTATSKRSSRACSAAASSTGCSRTSPPRTT